MMLMQLLNRNDGWQGMIYIDSVLLKSLSKTLRIIFKNKMLKKIKKAGDAKMHIGLCVIKAPGKLEKCLEES